MLFRLGLTQYGQQYGRASEGRATNTIPTYEQPSGNHIFYLMYIDLSFILQSPPAHLEWIVNICRTVFCPLKIFFFRTKNRMILEFCSEHCGLKVCKVCINDDPTCRMALTYSKLSRLYVKMEEKCKETI